MFAALGSDSSDDDNSDDDDSSDEESRRRRQKKQKKQQQSGTPSLRELSLRERKHKKLSEEDTARNVRRCADEVVALASMYGEEDVTDEEGVLAVRLTSEDGAISATLRCTRGPLYPDGLLENVEVVMEGKKKKKKDVVRLEGILGAKAVELGGEVCVFELAALVAEYLESKRQQGNLTLHEEMLQRERREREAALRHASEALDDEAKRRESLEKKERERRARAIAEEDEDRALRAVKLVDTAQHEEEESSEESVVTLSLNDEEDHASRYASDFRELSTLGRGGFGEVMQCQNKLDRRKYAVKKIVLPAGSTRREARKQLREVEALAHVSHPHCVRYYQAWIEGFELTPIKKQPVVEGDGWTESESDSEDDDETTNNPASKVQKRVLYIQMEYCATTLRELIDGAELHKRREDVWRLLREILEALAYLHEAAMVHRDLKPANVFVDATGTVKVGDFGLATTTLHNRSHSINDQLFLPMSTSNSSLTRTTYFSGEDLTSESVLTGASTTSLTGGVGTALYRAPELSGPDFKYDVTADIFSLGVVAFELVHAPFTTAMERIERLTDLRAHKPQYAPNVEPQAVTLVDALTAEDASRRPSASQLLAGDWLPARTELERPLLLHAQKSVANPLSKTRQVLLEALFQAPTPEHTELTYDCHHTDEEEDPEAAERRLQSRLEETLRGVFETHGAVEHHSPLLRPRPPSREVEDADAEEDALGPLVVGEDGTVLLLRRELTTAFARAVTRHEMRHRGALRCFEMGPVFAEPLPAKRGLKGGKMGTCAAPRETRSAAYQVVARRLADAAGIEGETLALCAFHLPRALRGPDDSSAAVLKISHVRLAPALERLMKRSPSRALREAVGALSSRGPNSDAAATLEALGDVLAKPPAPSQPSKQPASKQQAENRLDTEESRARATASAAVAELRAALRAASLVWAHGDPPKILVDLELRPAIPFSRDGLVFAVYIAGGEEENVLLCRGGQFDSVVSRHAPPSFNLGCIAVGARFELTGCLRVFSRSLDHHRSVRGPQAIVADEEEETLAPPAGGAGSTPPTSSSNNNDQVKNNNRDLAKLEVATALREAGLRVELLQPRLLLGTKAKKGLVRRQRGAAAEALALQWAVDWLVLVPRDYYFRQQGRVVSLVRCFNGQQPAPFAAGALERLTAREAAVKILASAEPAAAPSHGGGRQPVETRKQLRFYATTTTRAAVPKKRGGEQPDEAALMRKVGAALEAAGVGPFALSSEDIVDSKQACCAVDAPLAIIRTLGAAAVDDRAEAGRQLEALQNHKTAMRAYLSLIDEIDATASRVLYAYSTHDDALDLLWLPARRRPRSNSNAEKKRPSKNNSRGGGHGRKN